MLKIEYFNKDYRETLSDFLQSCIGRFQTRNGVFLTVHAMNGRWFGKDGNILFSKHGSHCSDYCRFRRYGYPKNNRACLRDCAAGVEQACLKSKQPFLHTCWKSVTELVVPFVWNNELELIFYVGPFRGKNPPQKEFQAAWSALPEFPAGELEGFVAECQTLGLAFYARLLQENRAQTRCRDRRGMIREYISSHGCEPVVLTDLSAYLGISNSRTSHLCMSLLGESFQDLIRNERMKRAKFLLCETEFSLKEISSESGFSNVFYFTRMFRQFFQETPGRFRTRHRRSAENRMD